MGNISLDFSDNQIFQKQKNVKTYVYKDIGTSNFKLSKDIYNDTVTLIGINTSNYDLDAITASLTNLFSFRLGQEILEPLYRK
jgi:replicative DNA helicase